MLKVPVNTTSAATTALATCIPVLGEFPFARALPGASQVSVWKRVRQPEMSYFSREQYLSS